MMDEELIRGYYNDTLSDNERSQFEERVKSDLEFKALAESMELETLAFRDLERASTKSKFTEWESEGKDKNTISIRSWRVWSVAAALILVGTLTFRILNAPQTDLYNNYYSYYENFEVTTLRDQMQELSAREKAYQLYDQKQPIDAIQAFKEIDTLQKADEFFLSLCYLETENWRKAESHLVKTSNYDFSYQNASRWYLALVYLKLEDMNKSKQTLQNIESDSEFGESAKKLLKDISAN